MANYDKREQATNEQVVGRAVQTLYSAYVALQPIYASVPLRASEHQMPEAQALKEEIRRLAKLGNIIVRGEVQLPLTGELAQLIETYTQAKVRDMLVHEVYEVQQAKIDTELHNQLAGHILTARYTEEGLRARNIRLGRETTHRESATFTGQFMAVNPAAGTLWIGDRLSTFAIPFFDRQHGIANPLATLAIAEDAPDANP